MEESIIFANRCPKLPEIEDSVAHRLALQDWKAQLSASFNSLDRKLSSRNSCTSQLYQILGLFFVFHGLILTAVAQASALKCRNSWLIFTLSAMVSVATILCCIQKLREIAEAERNYSQEKALYIDLHRSIELLKELGPAFDLVNGQHDLPNTLTNQRGWGWMWTAFHFLVLFSGVNLAAINLIVCDPQRNTLSGG